VLDHDRHNHSRVFIALGLMHGNRIGQNQLFQLTIIIDDKSAVKIDPDFLILLINFSQAADIPVKNLLILVVPYLHDLVPYLVNPGASLNRPLLFVYLLLKKMIQIIGPDHTFIHRGQNLDVL